MKAHQVADAFANGQVGSASNLMSSGKEVFSYQMKIAEREPDGTFRVISTDESPSRTTSKHINIVRRALPSSLVTEVNDFGDEE